MKFSMPKTLNFKNICFRDTRSRIKVMLEPKLLSETIKIESFSIIGKTHFKIHSSFILLQSLKVDSLILVFYFRSAEVYFLSCDREESSQSLYLRPQTR